ncbi:unnamed protein product [Adineta steineri]|uniref:Uncharacterized protein n=1 Tax=Adineta steineri TaxID=433720 RepID=A0A815ZJ40_9BILA|nr:unnamed protein product [Adineta steineri]CAF1585333.1 unnamed protein product [Adineta steineri]
MRKLGVTEYTAYMCKRKTSVATARVLIKFKCPDPEPDATLADVNSSIVDAIVETIWPCWSRRDASTMTDDLVPVTPTLSGNIEAGHRITGPIVLLGYKIGEPVYQVTMALPTALQGEDPGPYEFHNPALFPKVLVAECGLMQVDITIRTGVSIYTSYQYQ